MVSRLSEQSTGAQASSLAVHLLHLLVLLAIFLPARAQAQYEASSLVPPKTVREFRGVWVATVANIDWPSRKGLSSAEQKAELLALLDRAVRLKLNTIIFQVRPACDALYASSLEPWSEYLTGTMGQAPKPFYDPLAFAVEEAHKRGLELHAWFNPYRARHTSASSAIAANHISRTHPQLVRQYGKQLWLDPGEPDVQEHTLAVVMDVVKRYDIDGVHFDDYFYPYPEKDHQGNDIDFPDQVSWQRVGSASRLSRDDWRRENVTGFIHRVYAEIKSVKPWVKFGISPFGIWRPESPPPIKGFDAYAKLFADSRKWLANGWVDYFAPQLYWPIDAPEQSFPVLLKWWAEQNVKGRHLVAGLDSSRVNGRWKPEEIINQIRLTRRQNGVDGHIHWDMKSLMKGELATALEQEVYAQPALVPASPSPGTAPDKPRLSVHGERKVKASWGMNGTQKVWLWLVQTRSAGVWKTEILPGEKPQRSWEGPGPEVIAISAVDRKGNLSAVTAVQRGKL